MNHQVYLKLSAARHLSGVLNTISRELNGGALSPLIDGTCGDPMTLPSVIASPLLEVSECAVLRAFKLNLDAVQELPEGLGRGQEFTLAEPISEALCYIFEEDNWRQEFKKHPYQNDLKVKSIDAIYSGNDMCRVLLYQDMTYKIVRGMDDNWLASAEEEMERAKNGGLSICEKALHAVLKNRGFTYKCIMKDACGSFPKPDYPPGEP
ncbi:hypothetical protein BJ875DRAFT_443671 [Amylocarpus encephaloides]|uniref:Uncharacterized protein n=1 Tax=Amylocarpus encephaloides TaxID=45428 RepID=A0A9P7YDX5_9HELO|nr:hypothetical protein BJ875DRAFT_443671 [Amylocarpus encephaloides]